MQRLLLMPLLLSAQLVATARTTAAASAPSTMVCFCHPSPPPYLFGPRSLVERAWSREISRDGSRYCRGKGGRQGAVCVYRSGSKRIRAVYGSKNQVITFDLLRASSTIRARTWKFLVALLPRSARLLACETVKHSMQGGPAKACLYRYRFTYGEEYVLHQGRTLVVAQYLHPRAGGPYGVVAPDVLHLGFGAIGH